MVGAKRREHPTASYLGGQADCGLDRGLKYRTEAGHLLAFLVGRGRGGFLLDFQKIRGGGLAKVDGFGIDFNVYVLLQDFLP